MKVCTETHTVAGFGVIPAGSLWDDDSPFLLEADRFADADAEPSAPPMKRAPVRKFKAAVAEGDDEA